MPRDLNIEILLTTVGVTGFFRGYLSLSVPAMTEKFPPKSGEGRSFHRRVLLTCTPLSRSAYTPPFFNGIFWGGGLIHEMNRVSNISLRMENMIGAPIVNAGTAGNVDKL